MYFGIIIVFVIFVVCITYFDDTTIAISGFYMLVLGAVSYLCVDNIRGGGNCDEDKENCFKKLKDLKLKKFNDAAEFEDKKKTLETKLARKMKLAENREIEYNDYIKALKKRVAAFKNQFEFETKRAQEVETKQNELKKRYYKEFESASNANDELVDVQRNLAEKENKLREISEDYKVKYAEEISKLEIEIRTFTLKIARYEEKLKDLVLYKGRITELEEKIRNLNIKHNIDQQKLNTVISTLEREQSSQTEEIDSLTNSIAITQNENQTLYNKYLEQENKQKELQTILTEAEAQLQMCKNNIAPILEYQDQLDNCEKEYNLELEKSIKYEHLYNACQDEISELPQYSADQSISEPHDLLVPEYDQSSALSPLPGVHILHETDPYPPVNQFKLYDFPLEANLDEINDNAQFSKYRLPSDFQYPMRMSPTINKESTYFYKLVNSGKYQTTFDLRRNKEYKAFEDKYHLKLDHEYLRRGLGAPNKCWWVPEISTQWYKQKVVYLAAINKVLKNRDMQYIYKYELFIYKGLLAYSTMCDRLFLYPCCFITESDLANDEKQYNGISRANQHYLINYGLWGTRIVTHHFRGAIIEFENRNNYTLIGVRIDAIELIRTYNLSILLKRRYCCVSMTIFGGNMDVLLIIDNTDDTLFYFDVSGINDPVKDIGPDKLSENISKIIGVKLRYRELDIRKNIDGHVFNGKWLNKVWCGFITLILNTFDVDINVLIMYFKPRNVAVPNESFMNRLTSKIKKLYEPRNETDTKFENTGVYAYMKILSEYIGPDHHNFNESVFKDSDNTKIAKYYDIPKIAAIPVKK